MDSPKISPGDSLRVGGVIVDKRSENNNNFYFFEKHAHLQLYLFLDNIVIDSPKYIP